jgi:CRP-like cAMP-binding protein
VIALLERARALRGAALFAPLRPEELLSVAEICGEMRLAPGERLCSEGDTGDELYVLVEGRLRVERGGRILADLGAGECAGELAALDREPRSATITAITESRLVRLERDDLLDLLGDHPELVRALAGVLAERIRKG